MAELMLRYQGYEYMVAGERLQLQRNGTVLAEFNLAPLVNGEATTIEQWHEAEREHFCANLQPEGQVHLAVREGYVCYWMETCTEQFDTLTYFPQSVATGSDWQTYLSDEHDRRWEIAVDAEVALSSAYAGSNVDDEDGAGMCDPGDRPPSWVWNLPVRACSFATSQDDWVGLCIPGPLPVGVTRLKMEQQRFSMTFQVLRPACDEGRMPEVYLVPGLPGPYDCLDSQRTISEARGWVVAKSPDHPQWWAHPTFKCWDELVRLQGGPFTYDDDGNASTIMSTDNLLKWLSMVEESCGLEGRINIVIDQYWFYRYGDRGVINELGGQAGLRNTIDELRERGVHTGLYLHQYMIDTAVPFHAEHPEAFCKCTDPEFELTHGVPVGADTTNAYIDWTHPLGRQYMLDTLEYILSDGDGCLNADWLMINNNLAPDPRLHDFHDPDWGIGDLMQYKVQRAMYTRAKEIKPDTLVRRQSPAEPCFQPFCDNANLCEHWTSVMTPSYERGRIATRVMRDVLFSTDAWFVSLTKAYEYYMNMCVWNVPEIESIEHAIHPYMYWRPLQEKDFRRRRAGLQVYMNAPINITDQCWVDLDGDRPLAWRKYTRGPLAGFYAALALSPRSFVTYSPTQALTAATETRLADIPLPPNAEIAAVQRVLHSGEAQAHEYELCRCDHGPALRTRIPDCAGEVAYLRICYGLGD